VHSANTGRGDAFRCIQFSSSVLVAVDASCRFRQRSRLRHSFALRSGSLLRYRKCTRAGWRIPRSLYIPITVDRAIEDRHRTFDVASSAPGRCRRAGGDTRRSRRDRMARAWPMWVACRCTGNHRTLRSAIRRTSCVAARTCAATAHIVCRARDDRSLRRRSQRI